MKTLIRYWPWWVAIGWLVGYELYAIIRRRPTLSRYAWAASRRWPPLVYVVTILLVILWLHFFPRLF